MLMLPPCCRFAAAAAGFSTMPFAVYFAYAFIDISRRFSFAATLYDLFSLSAAPMPLMIFSSSLRCC